MQVLPDNACQEVTWISGDESVATVDNNGLVTAISEGTVTISATVKNSDVSGALDLTVNPVPVIASSIEISGVEKLDVYRDKKLTITLTAVVSPEEANQSVKWSSTNPEVATVDEATGVVTAVAVGKTQITATALDDNIV